jgi:hypothetical protein
MKKDVWMDGWMDGWMNGWVDGVGGREGAWNETRRAENEAER